MRRIDREELLRIAHIMGTSVKRIGFCANLLAKSGQKIFNDMNKYNKEIGGKYERVKRVEEEEKCIEG
ncbi:MAG: hypothetical protein ACRC92_11265 [Peptostreptococcaceae bacterium]